MRQIGSPEGPIMSTLSHNKLALVTGGARGIGFGIAEALLARDYQVVVTGLTNDEVVAVPTRKGLSAIRLDVTNDESVNHAVAFSQRIDVLVNCAGMILRGGAEYEIDLFQKVMDVNLTGTMRMALAAREKLKASGCGVIINTASMLSFLGSFDACLFGFKRCDCATHKIACCRLGR